MRVRPGLVRALVALWLLPERGEALAPSVSRVAVLRTGDDATLRSVVTKDDATTAKLASTSFAPSSFLPLGVSWKGQSSSLFKGKVYGNTRSDVSASTAWLFAKIDHLSY